MIEAVGHYKILERIGEGPLGEIFRARDTRLGRTVAVKIPPEALVADADRREALRQDAQAASELSHPNIATLYEAGDESGRPYLVFEFVPGDPLDRLVAGQPLNPRRAIDLAAQIADGLADAHALNVVHGALAAPSVVVTPKGAAKIMDFGFGRWIAPEGGARDEAADITALGRLLFEMLTGAAPAAGEPAPPSVGNRSVPAEIDPVVLKAMGVSGHGSYDAAVTLAAELRSVAAVLDVRAASVERARPESVRGGARRSNVWWMVAAAVALVVAAAAWWWLR